MPRINEIFYSLQGEGHFTGTPAVFIRMSGCNLSCDFCDTQHSAFELMSDEAIVAVAKNYPSCHVVITGGEPTMQLSTELLDKLHEAGFFIQIETNGTIELPVDVISRIDWITCSPKDDRMPVISRVDELKVVYVGQDVSHYETVPCRDRRLQPCDVKDEVQNKKIIADTVDYVKANPCWRLSLQTHKFIDIP